MLELNSKRWAELNHAYGDASDLPELMARLHSGDESSLDELFGAICHQGSVYSASFATVPHLVEIAAHAADGDFRANVLILVGSIAASRDDRSGQHVAPDIADEYGVALPQARDLALSTLREPLDDAVAVYLLQAAASLDGRMVLGHVLSGFVDEEFTAQCPSCDVELYIWPSRDGLSVAAEDPVTVPRTPRVEVEPGPDEDSSFRDDFDWLTRVGGAAMSSIGARLPYLFGAASCPDCAEDFHIMDVLAESVA